MTDAKPTTTQSMGFGTCLKHLWTFLKPQRFSLYLAILAIVVMHIIYALMPTVEGQITSQLQLDLTAMNNGVPGAHVQMNIILQIIGTLLILYVIKIVTQFIGAITLTSGIQRTMYAIRNAVEHKINQLPLSYFDAQKTGDILSRITNDVETVSNALQQTLSRVLGAVFTFTFNLIMMLRISIPMTLIILIGMPLIALITTVIVKKSQPVFDQQQAALASLNSTVNELYGGVTEILVYNHQNQAKADFETVNRTLADKAFQAQFISGTITPLTSLITYLIIGCTALYGCMLALNGTILIGQLQAFIRYIWATSDPISQVSQLSNQVQSAFSGMNRLFTFLDLPEEVHPVTSPDHQQALSEIESIEFDHVVFSYTEQSLMSDMDLTIRKGQRIAVVGPTGAGKTTLINLLLRFYTIQSGAIRINGININDISQHDLRNLFGLVLQDAWLFEGTVEDNLRYGKDTASPADLERAIAQAEISDLIARMPQGLQTRISESAENISQGEKQLLTIARALLKDPKVLILDEATSSVDTRLEQRIQKAMDTLMESRTSIVIAHRLSTITNADLILVMDHGDIIESGTHTQLLEQGGTYARLYNSQFQDMDELE